MGNSDERARRISEKVERTVQQKIENGTNPGVAASSVAYSHVFALATVLEEKGIVSVDEYLDAVERYIDEDLAELNG